MAIELVLDEIKLKTLGQRMQTLWLQHKLDRKAAELRWLQNLRMFRGIYDPEIRSKIPMDRSKAYPKVVRWKVIGTIARLLQMLFPQTEKNYGLKPSPMPNLSTVQLQQVLDQLVQAKAGDGDPTQVELTSEEIEKAVVDFAKGKAARMELKVDDDLAEMEYITLVRKVVFSAVLYNIGVLKGPLHVPYKQRTWNKNPNTGRYEAQEVTKLKPLFEFLPVWNYYPDMSAVSLDKQDGEFERHIMTREQIEDLAKRPDFLVDTITTWLEQHKTGNHIPEPWETEMKAEPKSDRTNVATGDGRKYVTLAYDGAVTGHELRAAGVEIKDADLGKTFRGDVWLLDNVVIKAKIALLGDQIRRHHVFVFEEDDLSLLGNGQVDTLRDSQLSIAEAARMSLDEASIGGENLEVNVDLLAPGMTYEQASYKVWKREGEGASATYPAVRQVARSSRITELMSLVQMFTEFANNESGLPPPSMGDVSGGGSEALRTQGNASMFLGAAALPIRDTVRNFDTFTISVISALVKWNAKYAPDDSRDGDHDVIARGSTSLIAKEVLAQSLDQFKVTLDPEERAHLKVRALLEARAKARDIPIADLLEDADKAEAKIAAMGQAQQDQAQAQLDLVKGQVRKVLADAAASVAKAHKDDASVQMDAGALLIDALARGHENAIAEHVSTKPEPKKAAA